MDRCERCGTKIRDGGGSTPPGARVCISCGDTTTGAAPGFMSGGGLGGAMAGPGILRWVRESLNPRRKQEGEGAETATRHHPVETPDP